MATNQKTKTSASGTKPAPAKKPKRKYPVKFDSSGFKLMLFTGLGVSAVGALIVWAVRTAPEGVGPSDSLNNNISKTIVRALPESATQWIATILGILFILFGIFCIAMAIKIVIKYFVDKAKE